jgi:hypothetical protein
MAIVTNFKFKQTGSTSTTESGESTYIISKSPLEYPSNDMKDAMKDQLAAKQEMKNYELLNPYKKTMEEHKARVFRCRKCKKLCNIAMLSKTNTSGVCVNCAFSM